MSHVGHRHHGHARACPYRRDVPAGIWDGQQYEKLRRYDQPTYDQPWAVFLCHQNESGDPHARMCAGWVGCHDVEDLLALRWAAFLGRISTETYQALCEYRTEVSLFDSGAQAAEHGRCELIPGPRAQQLIDKIVRQRPRVMPPAMDDDATA